MASTYIAKSIGVPYAASQHMLSLWNPTGSGKILKVYRVWVSKNSSTLGVTGVTTILKLYRISASSGGITLVPISYDSSNTALGTVTTTAKGTITTSSLFRNYYLSNDEPTVNTGSDDEWTQYKNLSEIWNTGSRVSAIDPIVCRENQGLSLQNSTSTTVNFLDVFFEFTVE